MFRVFNSAKGILASIGRGIVEFPLLGIKKTGEMACAGLGKMDRLTRVEGVSGGDGSVRGPEAEETVLGPEGRLRVNMAVRSQRLGSEHCYRIGAPVVSTCGGGDGPYFQGVLRQSA